MYHLNLKRIPNANKLEKVIQGSKGKVLLKLPNNEFYNLKEEQMGTQLLKVFRPGRDGLDFYRFSQSTQINMHTENMQSVPISGGYPIQVMHL